MQELFVQTDKKIIATLPRYTFDGRIVVVQSESEAERAVQYLSRNTELGIDTETRPSFRKGQQHKVALLQVATPDLCFLFRLNYMGLPNALAHLLENGEIKKIGLSLKDDVQQLHKRRPSLKPRNFVDLQQIAAQMGIKDMSLAKLFANFFRQRISKNAQLSNWEADALDEKQRVYAATDADACLKLYHRMEELKNNGDFRLISLEKALQNQRFNDNISTSPRKIRKSQTFSPLDLFGGPARNAKSRSSAPRRGSGGHR